MTSVVYTFALISVIASAVAALPAENYLNIASGKNCSKSSFLSSRIIDGRVAPNGSFPYMASLRKKETGKHFCGGSIINDRWILTAAHCIAGQSANKIVVVVGTNQLTTGGKKYAVSFIMHHEKYNIDGVVNDVGLIKVSESIKFNKLVLPIALANSNIDENDNPATISGWGRFLTTSSLLPNDMQYINTCLMDKKSCMSEVPMDNSYQKICTFTRFGQGACNGDSGSPLVADGVQIGIASYVIYRCASGFPDVYTKVYSYSGWIKSTINTH